MNNVPKPRIASREVCRVWRWKCEDRISRYLSPFSRHGGLALTQAGLSLLRNRLLFLHGADPGQLRSPDAWEDFHRLCRREADLIGNHIETLPVRAELSAIPERLDAMQRRLARSWLQGQFQECIDGALDVSRNLPVADNDNHQGLEAMVIGDLVFWKQPALPEPPIPQAAWFTKS